MPQRNKCSVTSATVVPLITHLISLGHVHVQNCEVVCKMEVMVPNTRIIQRQWTAVYKQSNFILPVVYVDFLINFMAHNSVKLTCKHLCRQATGSRVNRENPAHGPGRQFQETLCVCYIAF